ncbi:hypothetical protein H9Y04_18305 [Streptomyces sp. TRM66268-LWL]|uniref:Uncharacterized protein n=1 Tax=Streptomyces polyasparticus TaxID=2767826 RepID=A0ABR7SGI5_9ACTN|nr:hypothetical protein [Streptomyces polyasparticus]MBC9714513.1 hypothetical protein [Streptomyces polyasparticus]
MTKPKGFEVFYLTTGKVVHTARRTDTRTLCNKPINGVRLCYTPYVTCTPCVKLVAAMAVDEEKKSVPKKSRDTGEKVHMTANDALTNEIRANIERARALATEGQEEALNELVEETEAKLKALKGAGSVKLRTTLRDELTAALKETPDTEEEDGKGLSGLVIPPDVQALVDQGAEKALEGVRLGVEMGNIGEAVSQIQLSMRLLSDHNGLPDLLAKERETQLCAALIYKQVAAEIQPDEVQKDDALKSLKRAVQNKNSDVLVGWLRALDDDKEAGLKEAESRFPDAAAAYKKAKKSQTKAAPASLTEAVYSLYAAQGIELPRKGRTELERERRQRAKELEAGDDSRLTPQQRLTNYVESITAALDKTEKNAPKLTGAAKRKARNDLQKLADRILAIKDTI